MVQYSPARPPVLIATRASVTYLLQSVRAITRHVDGDILAGTTVLALLQRRLAEPVNPAVSVQSLARSLKTPRETMRRCVGKLIALDWCRRVPPYGIVVSDSAAANGKIEALVRELRVAFRSMLTDLKQIGFDFDVMNQASEETSSPFVEMALSSRPDDGLVLSGDRSTFDRVILDFGLRIVDSTAPLLEKDFTASCVFTAILSLNASPFAFDPEQAWRYGTREQLAPDDARRPVAIAEVSQLLGVPYETARRYANNLVAKGHCVRDERKGLLVPAEMLLSPALVSASMAIVSRFVQMVGEMKRLGFDFRTLEASGA